MSNPLSAPTPAEMEKAWTPDEFDTANWIMSCVPANRSREWYESHRVAVLRFLRSHAEEAVKAARLTCEMTDDEHPHDMYAAVCVKCYAEVKVATEELRRQFSLQEVDHQNEMDEERQAREKAEVEASHEVANLLELTEKLSFEALRSREAREKAEESARENATRALDAERAMAALLKERDAALAEAEKALAQYNKLKMRGDSAIAHMESENIALRKRVEELEAEAHAGYLASAGKLLENHHQAIEQARREGSELLVYNLCQKARREGAEAFRERAADWHKAEARRWREDPSVGREKQSRARARQHENSATAIRALPIDPPKAERPMTRCKVEVSMRSGGLLGGLDLGLTLRGPCDRPMPCFTHPPKEKE